MNNSTILQTSKQKNINRLTLSAHMVPDNYISFRQKAETGLKVKNIQHQ